MKQIKTILLLAVFVTSLAYITTSASAGQSQWRIDLEVTYLDGACQDIAIGDRFSGEFGVDPNLFNISNGIQNGEFDSFSMTIGKNYYRTVEWDKSEIQASPQFLLSNRFIEAVSATFADTSMTWSSSPLLSFSWADTPPVWSVQDGELQFIGPVFGCDFGGVYTISPVLVECGGTFDVNRDQDVDGLDLASHLGPQDDVAGFASNFGSREYCLRPQPACTDTDNGWIVLKNNTPDPITLYIADMANAWGGSVPDTFDPDDFPVLAPDASLVDSLEEFDPNLFYVKKLPAGRYSILATRTAIHIQDNNDIVEYVRVVYLNSDVVVEPCTQTPQLDIDANTYNAYDLELPANVEEVAYDTFKELLDSGQLTLVNQRIINEQVEAGKQLHDQNITFVESRLEDLDPDLLTFLRQPIVDNDVNDPAGDNWHHTITPNSGQAAVVTLLGKKYIYANIAQNLKVKGTIENEKTAYLNMYNGLEAVIPPDDWGDIVMELNLMTQEHAQDISDVTLIEAEKQKILNSWHWIQTLLQQGPQPLKPDCENEIGAPQFYGLGPGATDQYVDPEPPHPSGPASNGVFKNYSYPLKGYTTCVRNQKKRGSCVAFGITGAIEASWAVQTNQWVNLSEQWLYYKAKNNWFPDHYDDGLFLLETAQAMKPLDVFGIKTYPFLYPYEQEWIYNASIHRINVMDILYLNSCDDYYGPYLVADPCSDTTHQGQQVCAHPFCGYYASKTGDSLLTNKGSAEIWSFGSDVGIALAKVLLDSKIPLVVSYSVTPSFDGAGSSGFVQYLHPFEENLGGHASLVTGYIDNAHITTDMDVSEVDKMTNGGGYLIVKNSWGVESKDAGYVYLPYSWVSAYANSLITVTAEKVDL